MFLEKKKKKKEKRKSFLKERKVQRKIIFFKDFILGKQFLEKKGKRTFLKDISLESMERNCLPNL